MPHTVLFLVAHQDDELLTFGGPIAHHVEAGEDAHVICLSKGEGSSVKSALGNGKACDWHDGAHTHTLTPIDFIAARDGELFRSCLALGVPARNILLPHQRFNDGQLSPWECLKVLEEILSQFEDKVSVFTHSPSGSSLQHLDHQALGIAAYFMKENERVRSLTFCIDPYFEHAFSQEHPNIEAIETQPSPEEFKRIEAAAQEYADWNPELNRFAIGYHSVSNFHQDLLRNPRFYSHDHTAVEIAACIQEWESKRERNINARFDAELKQARAEALALKEEQLALKEKLLSLSQQIKHIKASKSYRIGRSITAPLRALKKIGK